MLEFMTNPLVIIVGIIVIAAGVYGAFAWSQNVWPFSSTPPWE